MACIAAVQACRMEIEIQIQQQLAYLIQLQQCFRGNEEKRVGAATRRNGFKPAAVLWGVGDQKPCVDFQAS
ncbi:hypothetical protein T4E_1294 [Trichinella pseudospiralis]|uniref:Uncharacterized protein n=1 Tax=Trichinella pseudospiralis TaxID=6337 RepID=A0A0V0XXR5_TRIPS|nr:hypothetical protein T4E_1294 [Trichinella pseudospiralis]